MKLVIRIVLVVLAIPVVLFVVGFLGGLLGILELPEPSDTPNAPTAEVMPENTQPRSQPYRKPIEGDADAGETVAGVTPQQFDFGDLPDPLDATAAVEWLSGNQFLRVRDGLIEIDAVRFYNLSAKQALALLWAFKDAQNGATGDRLNQMRLLAGYVFMGSAFLPETERLAFAQEGKIVAWPGFGSDIARSGEFVLMFYLKGEPDQPRAEEAIRRFAPMLPGSAILNTLDRIDAVNPRQRYEDIWSYNLDKISHLSVETLEVLLKYIGPYDSFDRDDEVSFGYAKERLEDLIEELRAARTE